MSRVLSRLIVATLMGLVRPLNDVRRALITGTTPGVKLIHFGGRMHQLYDLAAGPGEKHDLASDPSKLAPATEQMQRFRARLREISVAR